MSLKSKFLSGTVMPIALGISVAASGGVGGAGVASAASSSGENPTAVPRPAPADVFWLAAGCGACGACGPCGPCGACNPCNPCAAANPCAASACGPCGPCGACGPCGPCGAAEAAELSPAEVKDAYSCIRGTLEAGYAKSGNAWASQYTGWKNYATQPYVSATHGGRYVNNYVNGRGSNYGLYENAGPAPVGTVLAKDSFTVSPKGKVGAGPLFLMEKMSAGFSSETGDWRYTLILPNGKVLGETGGKGSMKVGFCADCHQAVEEQDSRFFLEEEYRVQ